MYSKRQKPSFSAVSSQGTWPELLGAFLTAPSERPLWQNQGRHSVVPVWFVFVSGIESLTSHQNTLLELLQMLSTERLTYRLIERSPEKPTDPSYLENFNRVYQGIAQTDSDRIRMLKLQPLLPLLGPLHGEHLRQTLVEIMGLYRSFEPNENVLRNFLIKLLFWMDLYMKDLYTNWHLEGQNPKILIYHPLVRDEFIFYYFLSRMGMDVLIFDPTGKAEFRNADRLLKLSLVLELGQRAPEFVPIRQGLALSTDKTEALKASRELDTVLHTPQTGLFSPWQYEGAKIQILTLQTTYEELFLLACEEARFRHGFEAGEGRLRLPVLFAKVSGMGEEPREYWQLLASLCRNENMSVVRSQALWPGQIHVAHHQGLIQIDNTIDRSRLKKLPQWRYGYLKESVQEHILGTIEKVIRLRLELFSFESGPEFDYEILFTLLSLEKDYLDILQKYDFTGEVPKLVVFDNDQLPFNAKESILVAFLHLAGFDVVIFTPSGYNNIEAGIQSQRYDIHKLPQLRYEVTFQEGRKAIEKARRKSWFSRLF